MGLTWKEVVEKFNDGDDSIIDHFGGIENFIKILYKKKILQYIDIESEHIEDYINYCMLLIYDLDKELFINRVVNELSDVVYENGKYYYVENREELSRLFCDTNSRRVDSSSIASRVLSDDGDYFEHFTIDNVDLYDDVIRELNKNNLDHLKKHVVQSLSNTMIEPSTELLESIAEDQDHPDYALILESNINDIFLDSETTEFIFEEYLSEDSSNLMNLYRSSYDSSYSEDIYDDVWSELSRYFVGDGEFITINKGKYSYQTFKVEILNFESEILKFLKENLKYNSTISYYGEYINIIKSMDTCLSIYPRDYPSSVGEHINDLFLDYI